MFKFCLPTALSAGLLLSTGCGPLLIHDDARSVYVPVQAGTFALHKDITPRGGHTRAYLQGGALVFGVNEFRPHCQLQVNTLRETPQTVHADTFTITRASTRTDYVVQATPLQLAALNGFRPASFDHNGDGESRRMYVYLFYLHSDRQSDVRALICGGAFDSPGLAERPTLGEIAEALGAYGTLTLQ